MLVVVGTGIFESERNSSDLYMIDAASLVHSFSMYREEKG
jgi:hypothetical protein